MFKVKKWFGLLTKVKRFWWLDATAVVSYILYTSYCWSLNTQNQNMKNLHVKKTTKRRSAHCQTSWSTPGKHFLAQWPLSASSLHNPPRLHTDSIYCRGKKDPRVSKSALCVKWEFMVVKTCRCVLSIQQYIRQEPWSQQQWWSDKVQGEGVTSSSHAG